MGIRRNPEGMRKPDDRSTRLEILKTIPEVVIEETHQSVDFDTLSEMQQQAVIEENEMREKIYALIEMRKEHIKSIILSVYSRYELDDPNAIEINMRVAPTFSGEFVEYVVLVERHDNNYLTANFMSQVLRVLGSEQFVFNEVPSFIRTEENYSSVRFFIRDITAVLVAASRGIVLENQNEIGVQASKKNFGRTASNFK